jgi:ATP-dependent exoDNAse (exonuclease V) beta subunit (contains helicase and exonuclease domains)
MTAIPDPLDALTLPLQGSRLIEASAGTGKTWTIAALYLAWCWATATKLARLPAR